MRKGLNYGNIWKLKITQAKVQFLDAASQFLESQHMNKQPPTLSKNWVSAGEGGFHGIHKTPIESATVVYLLLVS